MRSISILSRRLVNKFASDRSREYVHPVKQIGMPQVYLVTGSSSGFGKELVQEILRNGDYAIATARKPDTLQFEGTSSSNYLALQLDVTDESSISEAFAKGLKQFGRIDVVNNAGYGLLGPFEELSDKEIRQQLEVNFFGLMNVTRIAIETMRSQNPPGGLIQQLSSVAGQVGLPMFSIYGASKWAVEGFTEAISKEMKPEWKIKFNIVEPGGFRTDWSGRSASFPSKRLEAYSHLDPQEWAKKRNGTESGDPVKASAAIYKLSKYEDPPLRTPLGSEAFNGMVEKVKGYRGLLGDEGIKGLALGCDVDGEGKSGDEKL